MVYILKERNGEYEYIYITLSHKLLELNLISSNPGEHLAETFYENLSWVDYGLYYFKGGVKLLLEYYGHKINYNKRNLIEPNYIK